MSELVAFILFEPEAEESMAKWVREDVVNNAMSDVFLHSWYISKAEYLRDDDDNADTTCTDIHAMQCVAKRTIINHVLEHYTESSHVNSDNNNSTGYDVNNDTSNIDRKNNKDTLITSVERNNICNDNANSMSVRNGNVRRLEILLIVIFWDGQSEASKQSFIKLKQLADEKSAVREEVNSFLHSHNTTLHLTIQALNAKKGAHTVRQSREALISTLYKKLELITNVPKWKEEVKRVRQKSSATMTITTANSKTESDERNNVDAKGASNNVNVSTVIEEPESSANDNLKNNTQDEQDRENRLEKCDVATTTTTTNNNNNNSNDTNNTEANTEVQHSLQQNNATITETHELTVDKQHILKLIEDGQGENFYVLTASTREELARKVNELHMICSDLELGFLALTPEPRQLNTNAASVQDKSSVMLSSHSQDDRSANVWAQEFLLRRWVSGHHMELRLAMCGNVDSGKSTLTSVMTRGCHDDGRGFARAFVFNHKHEAATGRTSSISENHLGFTANGEVANYIVGNLVSRAFGANKQHEHQEGSKLVTGVATNNINTNNNINNNNNSSSATTTTTTTTIRQYTPQELASQSAKVFTLYDLAGHERYLKTTVLGMTRNMPDYACVVISANNGIQRMTKEHIALCLALKLPFFVVITRIDATPANVFAETKGNINKLLKIPTVRKLPYPIRRTEELIIAAKNLQHDRITPIFEVSNVTGEGIANVLKFLNLLPMRKDWRVAKALPREMIIDTTFFVTGVGTVVGGVVTQGVFHVNDTVLLGPDSFGHFRPVTIKSIHVKGVESSEAEAGNDAAFCLKKERRSAIRKGNILADPRSPPIAYWQFEAEVTILYHSTTISVNYEPVIHSNTVRQSARIVYVAKEVLRTGDHSLVRFHFLYRPEFMKEGQRLIFREGRTKGIGTVTKLFTIPDEKLLKTAKARRKYPLTLQSSTNAASNTTNSKT